MRMVVLRTAQSPMEAELIAGFLRSAGIDAFVDNVNLWTVRGEVAMDAGSLPRVLVRDADHARAAELLAQGTPGGATDP